MKGAFFMVLGAGVPVVRHPNIGAATNAAEKLARQHPDQEFVVLQSVASVKKTDVVWEHHDSDSFGIPF